MIFYCPHFHAPAKEEESRLWNSGIPTDIVNTFSRFLWVHRKTLSTKLVATLEKRAKRKERESSLQKLTDVIRKIVT